MNDDRNYDLHTYVEDAWASYRDELASFIGTMPEGEELRITAESGLDRGDGDTPWIQVDSVSEDNLRSTSVLAAYLYDGVEPPAGNDAGLRALGWRTPAERNGSGLVSCSMLRNRRDAADLATSIVAAFRDIWQVTHPAFLSAQAEGGNGRQFRTAADRLHTDSTAVIPLDIDHLRALVVDISSAGHLEVSTEDNGDVAIDSFALPIHVCFGHDATSVRLHAPLVTGLHHSKALSQHLSRLNTRWTSIKFVVAGGQLFAGVDVATQTLIPLQLTRAVFSLGLFVDRIDEQFASELGGTVFDPAHTHADPLPKVTWSDDSGTLGTLRAACELTGGPVDTATVEALCRAQDLAELTERARWSAERFRGHAHRLGDERRLRAAVLCDRFAAAWEDVRSSLQQASEPKPATRRRGEQIQLFEHLNELALFDV